MASKFGARFRERRKSVHNLRTCFTKVEKSQYFLRVTGEFGNDRRTSTYRPSRTSNRTSTHRPEPPGDSKRRQVNKARHCRRSVGEFDPVCSLTSQFKVFSLRRRHLQTPHLHSFTRFRKLFQKVLKSPISKTDLSIVTFFSTLQIKTSIS